MKKNKIFLTCCVIYMLLFSCAILWHITSVTPQASKTWVPTNQTPTNEAKTLVPSEDKYGQEKEENTPRDIDTSKMAFIDILNGSGMFFQKGEGSIEEVTLEQYCETFTESLSATLTNVALVDLEHDSVPEVIFRIALGENLDNGFLVLHWEGDNVWGYTFSSRQLSEIKENGTFIWSTASSSFGIATITFFQGEYTYQDIVWVEEVDNLGRYYKDNVEITRNEFNSYIRQHSALEDVHWVEYSERNNLFQ